MPLLVDTVQVTPVDLATYLDLIRELAVPVMTTAGAELVSCRHTDPGLGEPVDIQVTWSFRDHVRWNEIRRDLVLDPRWHELAHRTAGLRLGGTRRFYQPTEWSPC